MRISQLLNKLQDDGCGVDEILAQGKAPIWITHQYIIPSPLMSEGEDESESSD
ncbi:hypothetical protein RT761_02049 [Atribacter laminatus]|uniref:Uncharacterized protein n=1 Tax=Atribacter laminatus TaxID=2847778 RepID=A0A7T1AMU3_ATRLM|nr:hypothetical protein RT761_02049 [Atribacter laminatus]